MREKRRIWKRLAAWTAAACMCLALVPAAYVRADEADAADEAKGNWPVDLDRSGSIAIDMKAGGDLNLFKVADVVADNGYKFSLTEAFSGITGADLITNRMNDQTTIGDSELATTLADYADSANLEAQTQTASADTTLLFADLPVGLYLVAQTRAATGYNRISPFLVSIPGEGAVYEVNATPKMQLTELPDIEGDKPGGGGGGGNKPPTGNPPSGGLTGRLPQTGQLWWPVFVLAAAGVLLIAAGILRRKSAGKTAR